MRFDALGLAARSMTIGGAVIAAVKRKPERAERKMALLLRCEISVLPVRGNRGRAKRRGIDHALRNARKRGDLPVGPAQGRRLLPGVFECSGIVGFDRTCQRHQRRGADIEAALCERCFDFHAGQTGRACFAAHFIPDHDLMQPKG